MSHLDREGKARMVDVGEKQVTRRRAVAEAFVSLPVSVSEKIREQSVAKGNVLGTARIAAIQAAKRCSDLIPLCHPIPLDHIDVSFEEMDGGRLRILGEARASAKTGVEMEALTAVTVAALTIYDMVKGLERGVTLGPIRLLEKSGGKSGTWRADGGKTEPSGEAPSSGERGS
jgi:cyclic pyranopterin phosphate synthase